MMPTEQEASTKRCQESFGNLIQWQPKYDAASPTSLTISIAEGENVEVNAFPRHCLGSACMAWRWAVADRSDTYGRENGNKGYCGKAGKP